MVVNSLCDRHFYIVMVFLDGVLCVSILRSVDCNQACIRGHFIQPFNRWQVGIPGQRGRDLSSVFEFADE